MQHRGEIIRKAVYNSGSTITEIAKSIGKSRKWMYLKFENNNVPLDLVLQIGKIIHHDFSGEIKELKNAVLLQNEESSAEYWKNKYLKLLEEYTELLKATKESHHK